MLIVISLEVLEIPSFRFDMMETVVDHIITKISRSNSNVEDYPQLIVSLEDYSVDCLRTNEHEESSQSRRQHKTISKLESTYGSMGSI